MQNLKSALAKLPESPGVYLFRNASDELLYVGKSISIKKRVSSYFAHKNLGAKTNALVTKISSISHIKVFSEFEALLLESDLIRTNKPFYNIIAKDDKSPIYIKITKSDIPLVEILRKPQLSRKDFIKGPFPSAKATRSILRQIRHIFPYCHHKNPKKACLYVHLGLCPYPFGSQEAKQKYLDNIKNIKKLLSGKAKALVRDLTGQMQNAAKNQDFEQAQILKAQMQNIEYLTTTYTLPREFLEKPTLVDDLTMNRLVDLKEKLSLAKIPKRIECFDISNISGKLATGSMVVMTNGFPDKSQYRRFKIKFTHKPDDFEMIREVVARRLKNDWPIADLMIIDGGKGQLSSALEMINKYHPGIPVVSLAKRLEEIYLPYQSEPLSLPKESPARQLAQQIRDEAHRFAITYHRLLRSKNFLNNKST